MKVVDLQKPITIHIDDKPKEVKAIEIEEPTYGQIRKLDFSNMSAFETTDKFIKICCKYVGYSDVPILDSHLDQLSLQDVGKLDKAMSVFTEGL